MKNRYIKLVLVSLLLTAMTGSVMARECTECKKTNPKKNAAVQTKAAVCKRAQSTAELNVNNVRALINGYGNMWYDGSVAQYHLPKNSNTCPLYCAALWIGGTDVNDQLRLAALRFGSEGDDYWPGPLKINGTAAIDLPVCNKYDKHFIITKAEVLALKDCFTYDSTGKATLRPGKENDLNEALKNDVIANWPAKGDGDDLSRFLAPFYDANKNGEYEPSQGDYPYYDFENALCPKTIKAQSHDNFKLDKTPEEEAGIVKQGSVLSDQVLKGDQTIWWVFNDMGNTHTETQGKQIGLEIRAQAFAFSTNDEINNMTFYSYEIINRSSYELRETYFSQWVDPDLGYAGDDYVGCDVRRGLGYCYNGDESDGPGSGTYSGIPPAVGIDFFQGPYMDPDGKDNPKINIPGIINGKNLETKALLAKYKLKKKNGQDSIDDKGRQVYDTIGLSDDADIFYNLDPSSWYFVPGDAVGNCAINGVNFGNNIIDDERFGMRRFVYYVNSYNSTNGEPDKASDYYYYLRGYWKTGQRMTYGGDGTGANGLACDFMFPGDSDPWHWGTDGKIPEKNINDWTQANIGDTPNDRRFMQSAGPFTLKPGALNYITVGIPFAQATSGNAWQSVESLREIDDVCQALFENCFKVLDGPQAPTLTCQELNNEVILYINYENEKSNNYKEKYSEIDPSIVKSYVKDSVTYYYSDDARSYKFEGYQIYQLKDATVSVADIGDVTKARLVAQCDLENYYDTLIDGQFHRLSSGDTVPDTNDNPTLPIGTLVNYTTNSATGLMTGQVMVNGANKGIQHVFRITTDQFATGTSTALVNNREYYYIAIAYAHNRYKAYSQTEAEYLDGQKEPYLAGRQNEWGGTITPITVIPHNPVAEDGGKLAQSEFGMCPNITRLEGHGNGGLQLRLTQSSIDELMGKEGQAAKGPGELDTKLRLENEGSVNNPCIIPHPMYEQNYGPINVRVIDPLKIKPGQYNLLFYNNKEDFTTRLDGMAYVEQKVTDTVTKWCVVRSDGGHLDSIKENGVWVYRDTIWSDFTISRYNEQILQIFTQLGLAVTLVDVKAPATEIVKTLPYPYSSSDAAYYGGFATSKGLLGSSITFADENKQWLYGVYDNDSYLEQNWIRSGTQYSEESYKRFFEKDSKFNTSEAYLDEDFYKSRNNPSRGAEAMAMDKEQTYEGVLYGLWAPYALTSTMPFHPGFNMSYLLADEQVFDSLLTAKDITKGRNRVERNAMTNRYNRALNFSDMSQLPSVRIVFTADQTKWTRCPVVEMCDDYTQAEGQARKFMKRRHASVDKYGKTCDDYPVGSALHTPDVNNPDNPAYISADGMGWFPGYAINVTTGERLNVMFGEDSRFIQYNGRDMIWNPVNTDVEGQNYIMGGRHYIYVMNSANQPFYKFYNKNYKQDFTHYPTPSYDAGRWANQMLNSAERMMKGYFKYTSSNSKTVVICRGIVRAEYDYQQCFPQRDSIALLYASAAWVNIPLVSSRYQFNYPGRDAELNKDCPSNGIPCDVTVDIDVAAPYKFFLTNNGNMIYDCGRTDVNEDMPAYQFTLTADDAVLEGLATAGQGDALDSMRTALLEKISVVPNPYYSYSNYETASQLETKVRFINLPTGVDESGRQVGCTIHIYTLDGTLVQQLGPTPVNSTTYDWDLHNHVGIPIAGGMYLIHINVPGIGERVVKWFGTMRPVDLNSFQF